MPTIQNSTRGQVVQIWGKAYIRGTDGVWRPLTIGETVPPGAEILTEQNAIVMMTRGETPLPKVAESPTERAISAVEKNEEPPAAGLQGGGSGDLQPGLRVDRIVELVTPAAINPALDGASVEFGRATQSDPGALAQPPSLVARSSRITALEEGSAVNLGLTPPSGPGAIAGPLTITVTAVPTIGDIVTADGTPVSVGSVLTADQLAGLTYRPPVDYSAGTPVGNFGYSVSNGIETVNGGTRIAVTPVNDAPLAIDGSHSGAEDILLDVSLSGTDIDGTVVSVSVATPPANGTLLLRDTLAPVAVGALLTPAQAASLVFRPNANWNGSTSFTFTVTDNEGAVSAPATVQLQITPLNDPPLAINDTSSTVAQAPVTVAVLGNDSDADNDPLTVTTATVSPALGSVVVNGDGTLTFTAAAGVTGAVAISYTIRDPSGATSTATLTVNVVAAPTVTVDAPALTNDRTPTLVGTSNLPPGSTVTLTVTDANGAVQTFTTPVRADGTYSVDVPSQLAEGPYTAVATVNGPGGTSATANDIGEIDITPPVITVDAPALTNDSTPPLTGTTDLPAGSTITLTVTGANGVAQLFTTTVQPGGVFSVDVPLDLVSGPFTVSARGTDAAGNPATATDNGVVDAIAPIATLAINPVTADNIVNAAEATGNITITGTVGGDVQVGDTVTLNIDGVNYSGVVVAGNTFAISVPGSAVLADADRRIDGSVTTSDLAGNSATATAQRPYAVNTAPVAVDDTLSIGEDTASAGADVTPGTVGQDSDADGDTLTVLGVATGVQPSASGNVNSPLSGAWGTLLLDAFGAYTYAPSSAAQALDAGQTVSDIFTYTISDGRGGSATATLTISVVGADDPTTIGGVFIGTVTEDAVATASGTLTSNDPDVGTRAFVVQTNSAGAYGSFSIDAAGDWSYVLSSAAANVQALAQGQSVSETFIVSTDDGTTASITVTVNGANDAPTVSSTAINAVEEGAAVALGLTAPSDIDNSAVLAITVTGLPTIGQVQLADGTPVANGATLSAAQLAGLRYLPPADYNGAPVGAFAYTVSDGIATVSGGTTITVAAINDRPLAIDVSASGLEDTTTRIPVTLAGSDVDGTVVSYTLASVPANGQLFSAATGGAALAAGAVVTGTVYFRPNANFNGTVTFGYTATDDSGAVSANTATATIVVGPVNDAPTLTGVIATFNYNEGTTPTVVRSVIDGSVVLADIDSPEFGGGSVTVAIANVVAAEDLLGVRNQGTADGQISVTVSAGVTSVNYNPVGAAGIVTIGTLTGGSGSAPLVIALNGNATVAAVDALLQNITYGNASQLPTTTTRNLTITVVDGDGTANGGADTVSTNVNVNIARQNDAPIFTSLGGTVTYAENGAPVVLDSNAQLNDPELGSGFVGSLNNLGGSVLTVARNGGANAQDLFSAGGTLSLSGGNVVLAGVTVGSYDTAALPNGTLQITFANGTTQAQGSSVLQQIRYANASDAPPASVAIGYVYSDGNSGAQGTPNTPRTIAGTVNVTVTASNDRPVAIDVSASGTEDSTTRVTVTLAGSDVDGTVVSYRLTSLPANGDLYSAATGGTPLAVGAVVTGPVYFLPRADFDGTTTFGYTATDNGGLVSANTATATITIAPVNDAPTLGGIASSVTFVEDGTTTVTPLVIDGSVLFADVDSANLDGGSLTVAIGNAVAGQDLLDIANQGTGSGQISVSGSNVLYNPGSGAVVIGAVSGGTAGGDLVIVFNSSATPAAVDALIQNLRYTNTSQLPDTTPRNLTITVVDGDGGTDTVSVGVTVNITSTNDAPTLTALGGTVSFSEGGAAVVLDGNATLNDVELGTGFNGSLDNLGGATLTLARNSGANAQDAFSGSGTLTLVGGNVVLGAVTVGSYSAAALAGGTLAITFANGTTTAQANAVLQQIAYENTSTTPPPSLTVGYVFSDANSGAQGVGGALSASGSVTVNIGAFNNPPLAADGSETTGENTPLNASVPAATDIDGTISGYALASSVGAGNGALVFNSDGTFTFNPGGDFDNLAVGATRDVTFTYTATDNGGAISAPATVTITVTGSNDGPVAFNASRSTGENSTLNANVPAGADVDGTVTGYTLVGNVGANNGTLTFNSDGSFVFATGADFNALAAGQSRDVTFTYTATDNDGAVSTPATVTITVTGANDAPTGADATYAIAEDGSRAFAGADFGFADIDVGDTLAAVRIDSLPAAGTLTLNGTAVTATQLIAATDLPNLVFMPLANATGAPYASFTFSVQDNGGLFDSAPNTITFNVTPDNDPPVALVTPASGNEDTPIAVSLTGTDIDGSVTAVTVTVLPSNGTLYLADGVTPVVANTPLSVAAAASLIFRPAPDFNGSVNVTFTVTDNNGAVSAPAVSPITVAPVVDPAISISDVSVNESAGSVTFTVTLDQPTTAAVSVNFSTSNGTATSGADYTALSGTVNFAPGVVSRTIEVTIADDGTFEGSETFNVVLSGAVNATIADATGVATITDNDAPTLAVSSPTVVEGGFAVFTVSLSNGSTTDVTFNPTLASGSATVGTDTSTALEFFNGTAWVAVPVGGLTIAAGSTSVQVRVATTDDVAAEGSESFDLIATVTAGTTTNASATGTASITDDADAVTVTLTATPNVAEGGSILYTATLSSAAVTPMTVTLSSGQTIAIAAGDTFGTLPIPAPTDDVYIDFGSVSRSISTTTGGGFEAVTIDPALATTNVSDTIDTTTATLTATPSVVEGGQITYTVSLAAPLTGSAVVVTLAGGQTITIPVGSSFSSAVATAPDNVFSGGGSVANNIVSVTGGNFEQLTPNTAPVTTTVTDDADPTMVTLTATPSVVEGGSIVYTATLTNAAQTPVTVTLSNGATITIAAGTTSNFVSVLAPSDDPYLDAGDVTTLISSATGGGFEQLDVNPVPAVTSVTDDVDATTVTLTATANVAEGGSIIYTATLTNAAQTPVTVTLSTGQIITIAAGDLDGSVSILAPTDDVYLDGSTVTRSIDSASGGNFEALNVISTPVDTTVSDTIDTTTVSITGGASVAEGATASYTVSLTSLAQTAVTINLTYSGTAVDGTDFTGVATVTIPAGSSAANFNLSTLQDALAEGAESFTVTIGSAAGGNFENLVISAANGAQTTTITDDDTPTIAVSSPTVGEGGFAVFTVSLSNASTTAVTFNPTLGSGTATVGTDTSTALEFFNGTAWVAVPVGGVTLAAGSTSVQVRVATTDDFAAEGAENFTLTATVTAGTTGNASAFGTATITDDVDATSVSLTATPNVAEGGSILYTATLANAAISPMTVTLSNGATIVIAAGDTVGTTPFAAPTDDVYSEADTVSATIISTSGGGFEAVTINTAPAETTVSDTIDTTTATLTATPSVAEGGPITWTVSLTAPVTGSAVTVTLAGGQTITIPVGDSSGFATGTAPDNVFGGGGSVANNIVSASGGNFEQLTPNTAPVTTTVTDDADITTVTLTATASVVEGAAITYTATLTNAAQTPVTITLSNGATITIAAGTTSNFVSAPSPSDDPYLDASTVSVTIDTATGGNFESLQINPAPADTDVTDDADPTSVSLSATASVAEGGNIIYTATLTNAAQTPVTVTLSTGQTITIAAGDLDGSVSILAPADDVYLDGSIVTRSIGSASGGNVEALNVNATPAATTVTDTVTTTTVSITGDASVAEGATAAYTVSLTSAAQTAVTVNLSYSGTAIDGTDFTGVATVTIAAGASSAPLNIASLSDVLAEGVENFTVTIASAAGGNFENLVVSSANGAQTTSIIDDDTPALSVSSPSIGEGGFAVFTVSLSNASTTAVVFTPSLASGSATVGTDTSTALEYFNGTAWVAVPVGGINIAAGSTNVQVRVATTDDFALEGDENFTLTATVTSGTTANASATGTATITDDSDVTTVALTATPSIAEGGSIIYTATLTQAAVTPLTVTLLSGETITIAAGATFASIPVLAPTDDPYLDAGNVSRRIASTSGGSFESLSIDVTPAVTAVSDTIDITTATLTATPSVAEGGPITYTVSLNAAVTGSAVNVLLANGQTVTIPVGSSFSSVNAIAPDNLYGGGATVGNSIVSASGGNFEQLTPNTTPVSTSVTDDGDVTTVSLTATASVIEGTQITYTATLTNAAQTPVTVTLSNGATITIAAGDTVGTAIVSAPSDDVYVDASTVSVTIDTATGGNFESLQINPAPADTDVTDDSDPTTLNLSATASVAEGGSIIYTATLTNAAQTPLTVTLSTGQTITIDAGFTQGSVTILAPTDDVYLDSGNVTRTIFSTSGGNFENLQLGTSSATTAVSDTINVTTVSITGDATVAEGAPANYTVSLTSPAQTAVTVNLMYSGTAADGSDFTGVASVVIPVGFSSAAFNVATLQDAIGEGAENFTVTISGAAGGNFENLVISAANGAATTTITDDDTPTIGVSSPTVGEGGFAVFTVSLSNASTTAVAFNPTLASGTATVGTDTSTALEYFNGTAWVAVPVGGVTIAAGSTSVQVRVATTDDFAAEGSENFTLTATVTAGTTGNASAFGTAIITDDVDATTVTLTVSAASVVEGGSITYTATVDNAVTGTPLVLTLSNGQTITIPVGQTSASGPAFAVRADDAYAQGTQTLAVGISSTSGANYEALTTTSTVSTTVTDDADATTVTLTASAATVSEGGSITYTATVNNAVTGSPLVVTLSNGQTITIPVGQSTANSVAFAVRGDDAYVQGTQTLTVGIASTTGANYETLTTTSTVSTTVTDDADATTVTLTASAATVAEGGSITYTATVNNAVTGSPLVITLSNGQTITIPVGQSSASGPAFAVRADDAYAQGTQTLAVGISSTSGANYEALTTTSTVSTTVTDDADATTVTLTASAATVAEGGSITYTATVNNAVTASPLVITLSNGQTITIPVGQSSASGPAFAVRADDAYAQGTQTLAVGISSTSGANYETLTTTSTVSTTVTDDTDATTVTLTASASTVTEGGSITYTATVNNAVTGTPLVVTLSNGQTITIPVGQSSASSTAFAVRGDDAYVQGTQTLTVGIASTSGANYETLTTTSTASTTVTDDADTTTVTLTASAASVSEGGSITYTATVNNAVTGSPLVITLSNGQTITIPIGQSSASSAAFAVRGDDAYVQGTQTLTVGVSNATGASYEALTTTSTVSTTVTDDTDATTVTLTASAATVAEGGSITYTATVNNAVTGSPLVLTLSNGQTITIPIGQSSASSVAFAVRGDDAYVQGTQTLTVGISNATGASYEALTTTSTASTTVTDDADATTVTLTASAATVSEGGSITYTATVSNPVTGSPFVVTLSNGQTITIPVGQSSASSAAFTVRADDAYTQGTQTLTVGISATSGANYEARNTSSTVSTTVTDDTDATTVTLTASTATVAEGGFITYTATVNNAVTGSPLVLTLSNGQTITIPVGQSSASSAAFAVRGDDAYVQGTQTLTVGISNATGASYEALTTTSTVSTTVTDDADATTVTLTASAASVSEGGSITYTATVNNAVTGSPLVITLSNGQTITIPVGQSSASGPAFAVRADDAYAQGTQTLTVGISSTSGANYEARNTSSTVSTTVTDDADATTVTLTASAATVSEGGSITYTATVNNAVTVTPLVLTLSNGQTITIPVGQSSASSAAFAVRADDAYVQGTQTLTVGISNATGASYEALTTTSTVSTTVTDDADATTVTLTASAASVTEGGSITYTATVNNAVTGTPLVITLSNGQTITIPVGQSSASSAAFAVRGDDAYVQGTQTLTVGISSTSGANYEARNTSSTVSTTVTDDADATTVTLTASAATVTEGGSITYTASVNNAVTGSPLVVTLSNGQTITIPVGQSSASGPAFAVRADDAYAQGTQTLNVGISSTSGGNYEARNTSSTVSTTVTDDADTATLSISGSASVAEGASGTYTLTLTSPAQTAVTVNLTYTGTAANGVDYTGVASVTILAGASTATFNIDTINDLIDEVAAESFTVTVASATGGNFENLVISGTNNSVTTAIVDNDNAPTIAVSSQSVGEADGFAVFTVSLSNPSSTATTVSLALANGATNPATGGGTDYGSATATNLQVSTNGGTTWTNATSATFAAGATSVLVRTPIANDTLDEANETFNLTATRTAGTTANASAVGITTITDNDATPSLSIGNVSVNESAGTMTFTVTLSAASGQNVTVNFGTSNGSATVVNDYTANSGLLTFAPGVVTQTITVNIAEDALTEASETLNVTLSTAVNASISGTGIGVGTIIDNDTPPQGRDATVAATEDTPFVFALGNFLMNDAEQGNNVNPSSVRIDTLPSNGSLYLNGVLVTAGQIVSAAAITAGNLTFEPASNANGNNYANFTFSVRDASGQFDLAPNTITVNVAAVSDGAPDARNDMFMTTGVTPIILTAAQLLSNDTLPDNATITSVGAASGGTLVNNGNGTYTWTPSGPGNGTFTYTLTDQDGQTDTATVRIVSTGANDDLATVNESALADGTGAGTITATGNLFSNDSGNTAVNSITFNGTTVTDGGAGDIDARAGYIGVNSTDGRLVVDSTGAGAGDYTYSLLDNADNSAVANDTSVTEVFSYDANAIDAALRVTITDDAPQAISRTVQVSEDQVPSYRLVLVLDVSGSMTNPAAGGEVRQVDENGVVTITTRLALAREALAQLVEEYYNQAQSVEVTLITFSSVATVINPGAPYTNKDDAVDAIMAANGTGGTNYSSALAATQAEFGTVDPAVRNAVYFISDGAPSQGDLVAPATSSGYSAFAAANGIDSYAVGVGTGIANTAPLNGIHNVDANGNGVSDGAIIVPDLNDLGAALLSTVPLAYGGNVVSSAANGNVLGADGGHIQTVTVRLDTNGDGTTDTDVTFTHDLGAGQIARPGAFPAGFPVSGDLLTLDSGDGFPLGTLTFNFSTGDYTYFTGGTAAEGDSFSFTFVATDNDGDVTPPATLTVEIADGKPVARPDTDTLLANQTNLEGNVITGLGTDAGLALGGTLTNFSPNGAGVDDAIDGAQVSSVAFKGVTYNLTADASGSGAGFTWAVAGGQLTWTATSGGERLVMAESGFYQYTPPTASLPVVNTNAAVTTLFNSAANAGANGVALSAISRTGGAQTLTYRDNAGTNTDGVGVTGGGSDSRVDNLEMLVVAFSQATHPQGVQGVSFVVSPDSSNLGDNGLGTISSLTYTLYDVAGNELGQFYSIGENTVTIPPQYSNIGRIEIEANSAAEARITSVSFSSINVNTTAAEVAPVEVGYTLTDSDGDVSSSALTLRTMSNNLFGDAAANSITGTVANDRIDGGAGNDTLNGGAGNDLLIGGAGGDLLGGGDGSDELRGGVGGDVLGGGNGNDIIVGGMGNDALSGGAGADVFRWELSDRGVAGTPAVDSISSFSTVEGDKLDLRDLLQGETLDGGAIGNLSNYLFVERTGSDTVVHISSNGGFTSGYNSGAEDQTIVLTGIDLTAASTLTSQQVIQDLLNNSRLAVDP